MQPMKTNASLIKAIELLGGVVPTAKALGVNRYQTVQQWVKSASVPAKYCPEIERATAGKIRCEELRPDVDWAYLRGTSPSQASEVH